MAAVDPTPALNYAPPAPRFPAPVVRRLSAVCSLYPWAFIAALYGSWFAARIELGHWPRPMWDDPGSIGPVVDAMRMAAGVLMLGIPAALVSQLGMVVAAVAADLAGERRVRPATAWCLLLAVVAWAGAWLLASSDPFHIVDWLME